MDRKQDFRLSPHPDLLRLRTSSLALDSEAVASIFQVATAYVRVHAREAIGDFLAAVTTLLIDRCEDQLCDLIYDYTLLLYLSWLRTQPSPYDSAAVAATNRAAVIHCNALLDERLGYGEHPERVLSRPYVMELTELLRTYAQMLHPQIWRAHDAPECALVVGVYGYRREEACPIFRVLLDIALAGDERRRVRVPSDADASTRASTSDPSLPDPCLAARADSSAAQYSGQPSQRGRQVVEASAGSSARLARGRDACADRVDHAGQHILDEENTTGSEDVQDRTPPVVLADEEGVDGRTRRDDV